MPPRSSQARKVPIERSDPTRLVGPTRMTTPSFRAGQQVRLPFVENQLPVIPNVAASNAMADVGSLGVDLRKRGNSLLDNRLKIYRANQIDTRSTNFMLGVERLDSEIQRALQEPTTIDGKPNPNHIDVNEYEKKFKDGINVLKEKAFEGLYDKDNKPTDTVVHLGLDQTISKYLIRKLPSVSKQATTWTREKAVGNWIENNSRIISDYQDGKFDPHSVDDALQTRWDLGMALVKSGAIKANSMQTIFNKLITDFWDSELQEMVANPAPGTDPEEIINKIEKDISKGQFQWLPKKQANEHISKLRKLNEDRKKADRAAIEFKWKKIERLEKKTEALAKGDFYTRTLVGEQFDDKRKAEYLKDLTKGAKAGVFKKEFIEAIRKVVPIGDENKREIEAMVKSLIPRDPVLFQKFMEKMAPTGEETTITGRMELIKDVVTKLVQAMKSKAHPQTSDAVKSLTNGISGTTEDSAVKALQSLVYPTQKRNYLDEAIAVKTEKNTIFDQYEKEVGVKPTPVTKEPETGATKPEGELDLTGSRYDAGEETTLDDQEIKTLTYSTEGNQIKIDKDRLANMNPAEFKLFQDKLKRSQQTAIPPIQETKPIEETRPTSEQSTEELAESEIIPALPEEDKAVEETQVEAEAPELNEPPEEIVEMRDFLNLNDPKKGVDDEKLKKLWANDVEWLKKEIADAEKDKQFKKLKKDDALIIDNYLDLLNLMVDRKQGVTPEPTLGPLERDGFIVEQSIDQEGNIIEDSPDKKIIHKWAEDAAKRFDIGWFKKWPNLIKAVIRQESNYDTQNVNPDSKAQGLMQIIPSTRELISDQTEFTKEKIIDDWKTNVLAGVWLLKDNYEYFLKHPNEKYRANKEQAIWLGLAAYNSRPQTVEPAIDKANSKNIKDVMKFLPKETANYLRKVNSFGGLGKTLGN